MAPRKTTARPKPAEAKPTAGACSACGGTGEVATTVRVGRKHRQVGQQSGFCLNCLGTGTDPDS